MSDTFFQQFLEILKRHEVKEEIKTFMKPVLDMLIQELYPYVYLCLMFVLASFLLILGIFILLLRNKSFFVKN